METLKQKKAQVTIFVIVAIVVVLAIVLFSIYNNFNNSNKYDQKTNVFIESFHSCLEEAYKISLESIAYRGGYFEHPIEAPYINLSYTIIPYYAYENENHVPSLEKIEKEIIKSAELDSEIYCLSQEFEGVEFSYSDHSVDVEILDKKVIFKLDADLTIESNERVFSVDFKNIPVIVNSRLKDMHYVSSEISENVLNTGGWFDITKLSELKRETGLNITVKEEYDDYPAYIYLINTDEEGYSPVIYRFANKFDSPDFTFPDSF